MPIAFDNSYARLPERMFSRVMPARAPAPRLIRFNRELAIELDLNADRLSGPEGLAIFSGREIADGSEPLAQAYAGHQFGNFVPQLGDGRAILLGEVIDRAGRRRDIQLKGSGRTPFSRGGDGRAALGPVLREYVVSEAMAALGIRTTRALAAVMTGEDVYREIVQPGAVLTRVASSHIRVGTFQFFASRSDVEALRTLADHVIGRHYPGVANQAKPYLSLLSAVIVAQADLVAQWMLVGFIHGVMNTDNSSVAGETIDYGPCAFMDAYDPGMVFSSIDRQGRYSYGNQPRMAHWNLTRLAEAMLPLLADDAEAAIEEAQEALAAFEPSFNSAYHQGLARKIGLFTTRGGDVDLANALLTAMSSNQVDFTLLFRRLGQAASGNNSSVRSLFADPTAYDLWAVRWQDRLAQEAQTPAERQTAMDATNPAYIPRNHHVETMIKAAVEEQDFGPFEQLLSVLSRPYESRPGLELYAAPPQPHERVLATYCGT